MIGNVTTAIVRCCWKPLWMGTAFAEPATERPTGSMWDRPPGAAAWIESTKLTVRQSKIFTFIRWCATRGSSYAAISRGKQILQDYTTAIRWYRLAADKGNQPAMNNLGHMYQFGK